MKKYLLIIVGLFLLTGCGKEYTMVCTGEVTEDTSEYTLNVTIHYDIEDRVKSLDYEMKYINQDNFIKACEEHSDKNPKCIDLTVSYSENDEITRSFGKKDIINMLSVIGANECK